MDVNAWVPYSLKQKVQGLALAGADWEDVHIRSSAVDDLHRPSTLVQGLSQIAVRHTQQCCFWPALLQKTADIQVQQVHFSMP